MTGDGSQYAHALYALAEEANVCALVGQQLETLRECFRKEPDYLRLLAASGIPKAERLGLLDALLRERAHPYVTNLLKLLTEKGKLRGFVPCCEAYGKIRNAQCDVVCVDVYTGERLRGRSLEKLTETLEKRTGKQVKLNCKTDPACMGGIKLLYAGTQLDGTVKGRLDAIKKLLINTAPERQDRNGLARRNDHKDHT